MSDKVSGGGGGDVLRRQDDAGGAMSVRQVEAISHEVGMRD